MNEKEKRFKKILEEVNATGNLNLEDLKDLTQLEKDVVQKLFHEGYIEEAMKMLEELNSNKDLSTVRRKMIHSEKMVTPLWKSALKYAAIFIGVLTVTYYFQMNDVPETNLQVVEDHIKLKTGDERILLIDQKKSQEIVSTSGEVVGMQKGSNIKYFRDTKIKKLLYNELYIPNGEIFNLELSDGTVVKLNSGTKIKYPVKFLKGTKREVYIEGEAYFDVAKDKKHPFIVHAEDIAVTVLGTIFNISSYKEDCEIVTVLVEGSVNIQTMGASNSDLLLKPGMKGSWLKPEQNLNKENVNTDLYTGWIKGELIFKNAPFKDMVKTLERKYNVSIDNRNKTLNEKEFTASFNTNIESIDEIIKVISEIHPFNYTIEKRTIIISSKIKSK